MCLEGVSADSCEQLAPYAKVHRNSGFPENRASCLDMTEAFQPRCYVQMQPFAEFAFVALTNSPEFEKLGTRKLVAHAM